jgi:hypothetical protein
MASGKFRYSRAGGSASCLNSQNVQPVQPLRIEDNPRPEFKIVAFSLDTESVAFRNVE